MISVDEIERRDLRTSLRMAFEKELSDRGFEKVDAGQFVGVARESTWRHRNFIAIGGRNIIFSEGYDGESLVRLAIDREDPYAAMSRTENTVSRYRQAVRRISLCLAVKWKKEIHELLLSSADIRQWEVDTWTLWH